MREKVFCRLSLAISLVLLFWIICAPHGEWLESENRSTSDFSLASPDLYFTDRLPWRVSLLRFGRDISALLGRDTFGDAFWGKSGYIFSEEQASIETLTNNLDALSAFANGLDIPIYTAVIGAKTDVLFDNLPPLYVNDREELWQTFRESGLKTVDLLPTLRQHAGEGKYLYYRGDHHLTTLGSYYCYRALAAKLGITPYAAKNFSVGVVKSDFSGSDARKMLCETEDKIALFRFRGDGAFTLTNMDNGESRSGLYNEDMLYSNDPYGVFPIADCGRARITLEGENRETLLLLCDSYGDALSPFLARHFDLDIIDPRYYSGSVRELIQKQNYTAVLAYFGMDTLAVKEILYTLKF